jgi:hypothetical protein
VRTQDIKNYSWNGAATPAIPPPVYQDSSGTPIPTYQMVAGRLHTASPGAIGEWIGKQFDWPMTSALADNEVVSGSLKFRINSLENNGNAAGNRIRLFQFNAPWANGLPALFTLMGADSTVDLGPNQWRPEGHPDWNKWEINPNVLVEPAPEGKTYLYNSFNMNNPATDPDYFWLIDNGTDHTLTWTARYLECDVVQVATALDGVPWTVTDIGRQYPDWLLFGGWTENSMAKAWPNMGAWEAEFSEIRWATTLATVGECATTLGITRLPNSVADGMAGIQLWIGCNENVVAGNTVRRVRGSGLFLYSSATTLASSMPRTWNRGLSTCFFNTVEENWTDVCHDGLLVSTHEETGFRPDFPRTLGTVVRHNTFLSNRRHGLVISRGSAGTTGTPVGPALLGTLVEQNFARDMQTGIASGSGSDGVVLRRNYAYFWHGLATPGSKTAFRVSRPGAGAWVDENTVEGASAGSHEGIRVLEKPD